MSTDVFFCGISVAGGMLEYVVVVVVKISEGFLEGP
jgi:hypothetical protein